jgi:3-oxosteroid 1-dehydrogenase
VSEPRIPNEMDVVVVGSGAAGLVCALVAAVGGLRVLVVEKSEKLGGTSAMSGGAVWLPANHLGRAAGVPDNPGSCCSGTNISRCCRRRPRM